MLALVIASCMLCALPATGHLLLDGRAMGLALGQGPRAGRSTILYYGEKGSQEGTRMPLFLAMEEMLLCQFLPRSLKEKRDLKNI